MRSRDTEHDWLEGNDSRTEQERQANPARLTDQQIDHIAESTIAAHASGTLDPARVGAHTIRLVAELRAERSTSERLREALERIIAFHEGWPDPAGEAPENMEYPERGDRSRSVARKALEG